VPQFGNGIGDPVEPRPFHAHHEAILPPTSGGRDGSRRVETARGTKIVSERGDLRLTGGLAYAQLCRRLRKAFTSTCRLSKCPSALGKATLRRMGWGNCHSPKTHAIINLTVWIVASFVRFVVSLSSAA